MRYLKILFLLITYIGHSQNIEINSCFLNIPLNESRDIIYEHCSDSSLFVRKKPKKLGTKNGKEIKIFSGFLKNLSPELIEKKIDTVEIQLSTGAVAVGDQKKYQNLLIFWIYYYSSDSAALKSYFVELKKQIDKICNEKSYHIKNFEIKDNTVKRIPVGYSEKWFLKNDVNLEIELKYEMLERNKKYCIQLEYIRFE